MLLEWFQGLLAGIYKGLLASDLVAVRVVQCLEQRGLELVLPELC